MNFALCEIKKNLQGTNSDGTETRTQMNDLDQKEEINSQPEQNEETRIQKKKMRRGLRPPGQFYTSQHPNHRGARRRRGRLRH